MSARYEVMVRPEKGTGNWAKWDIAERPFAIWDHETQSWWRGGASGVVHYKYEDRAEERIKTLEDGTFESTFSMYAKKPDTPHPLTFIRLWKNDRPISPWGEIERQVHYRGDWVAEWQASKLERFYFNERDEGYDGESVMRTRKGWNYTTREQIEIEYEYIPWVSVPVFEPRDDYHVEEKIINRHSGETDVLFTRKVSLLDWLLDMYGQHETLQQCWHEELGDRVVDVII